MSGFGYFQRASIMGPFMPFGHIDRGRTICTTVSGIQRGAGMGRGGAMAVGERNLTMASRESGSVKAS